MKGSKRRTFEWGVFAVAVLATILAFDSFTYDAKSEFESVSGVVTGFKKYPNTRGRIEEYVVVDLGPTTRSFWISGFFADELRRLRIGDRVEMLVRDVFVVELKSSGSAGFSYEEFVRRRSDEFESHRVWVIAIAVLFWIGTLASVLDRIVNARR